MTDGDIDPLAVYEVHFMTIWSLLCIYCTLNHRSSVFLKKQSLTIQLILTPFVR